MDLDNVKKEFSYSNENNSNFSSFSLDKEGKIKSQIQKENNNFFTYNLNINNIQLKEKDENLNCIFNDENNDKMDIENINKNQLINYGNNKIQDNQSRFINFFNMNEDSSKSDTYEDNKQIVKR